MNILLIEDDQTAAQSIAMILKAGSNQVQHAATGYDGLELANQNTYQLIVLDINLPDLSGYDVLKTLRRGGDATPVIVLSGLGSVQDKVRGLELGADDYLAKPFLKEELTARVEAVVRRSQPSMTGSVVKIGDLCILPDVKSVMINGINLHLTPREFDIVELLARRIGTPVSKASILTYLYSGMCPPQDKIVDVYICKIRRKMEAVSPQDCYISTMRGDGYVLAAPRQVTLARAA
jgi:two-component system cell cycle response regulator CtrA